MKSKTIMIFSAIIFILTIVVPGLNYIMKSSKVKVRTKTISLTEEAEEIKKMGSSRLLNVETYDSKSTFDNIFVANRLAYKKTVESIKSYDSYNAKYLQATSGAASKLFSKAEKLLATGDFDKAIELLIAAAKTEPTNDIMKLKIYQKMAMIFMLNQNQKQYLKSMQRYIETLEKMDINPQTKLEITKLKNELIKQNLK
ncbi:MAG: hypothetical protein QMC67_01770 [Candidatus Wallbacteria bacterium]